jgi:hypothetical protein
MMEMSKSGAALLLTLFATAQASADGDTDRADVIAYLKTLGSPAR